jgi:hypothetical protein
MASPIQHSTWEGLIFRPTLLQDQSVPHSLLVFVTSIVRVHISVFVSVSLSLSLPLSLSLRACVSVCLGVCDSARMPVCVWTHLQLFLVAAVHWGSMMFFILWVHTSCVLTSHQANSLAREDMFQRTRCLSVGSNGCRGGP